MEKMAPVAPGGGNTKTPPSLRKMNCGSNGSSVPIVEDENDDVINPPKKAKRSNAAKKWCFTLNNYTDEDCDMISTEWITKCDYLIVGKEVGESGTPHLQGYIEFESKVRPIEFLKIRKAHWESARGSREDSKKYCSKEGKVLIEYDKHPVWKYTPPLEWRDWQQELITELQGPSNNRTIIWYFDEEGGKGKTELTRFLCSQGNTLLVGGKVNDIKFGIAQWFEGHHGNAPDIIVINYTRSQEDYVSYEGLETVKDMCFFSGKYEGKMILGKPPHVVIFANFHPDLTKLSGDRWDVRLL